MTRNNADRLGMAGPPSMEEVSDSPVFSFPMPTEMVELPSQGLLYDENSYLYGKKVIEIKYMTTKQEDILVNKSYIKTGVVLDKLLQSVIIDRKIRVEKLLTGDRNALLLSCRISGYGVDYKTHFTCPSCGVRQNTTFDLADFPVNQALTDEELEKIKITKTSNNIFNVVLPWSKVNVGIKLLTIEDEKFLQIQSKNKKKLKLQESPVTDQIRSIIVTVNNSSEPLMITKLVESLPSMDSKYIRNLYNKKLMPKIDMSYLFNCSDCSIEQEVEVPLTADFFWPK